MISYNIMNRP